MAKQWYVATVRPMLEKLADQELRKQHFRVFSPRCRVSAPKPCGGERYRIKPYIPGYILIQFDIVKDRWESVNGTRGVGRLMMCGEIPSRVRRGVVEALLAECDGGETFVHDERFDKIISQRLDMRVGDRGTVSLGGDRGVVVARSGHARVGVMLEMFGRKLVASAPADIVKPVNQQGA